MSLSLTLSNHHSFIIFIKRKCEVYYPNVDEDDSELEMIFGKFQISYLSEQPFEDYVIRKLEVENLDVK
jgi:hypothetical protein